MGWRDWLRRGHLHPDPAGEEWRRAWAAAIEAPGAAGAGELRRRLQEMARDDDRYEIEREMLEGLDALVELSADLAAKGLRPIVTGHRAVGTDRCYFSAPASLPDDHAQPAGTLLLTSSRAIFVGGARAVTVPWHAVAECLRQERDLVLVRGDRQDVHRFRCNSFTDSLRAALLARRISSRRV